MVGGRNLGDEYFGLGSRHTVHFRDLDVAIAGPAAAQATRVFNTYWESPLARPAALTSATAERQGGLPGLREVLSTADDRPAADALLERCSNLTLAQIGAEMMSVDEGAIRVVADPPEKARRGWRAGRRARKSGGIAFEIADALRGTKREALLISPYFVPGRLGLRLLLELRRRGVRVSVITNSLAATDVVAVHAGYARYRRRLLRAGVSIFELKPRGPEEKTSLLGSRGASLHTKAFVVDRELAFVGSFNLDHRSIALNTEMGAFIRDPRIAEAVAAEHARLAEPDMSWEAVWDGKRMAWREGDALLRAEPATERWKRAVVWLVQRLPVEEQL